MSTWTYGTMTDDERAQLDADIAADANKLPAHEQTWAAPIVGKVEE